MSVKPSVWSILLFCSLQVELVWSQNAAQFSLEVTLLSYANTDTMDISGECCRSNCRNCFNRFTFCAKQNSESTLCDYGMTSFELNSDRNTFNFQGSLNQDLSFSAPSIGQWPEEFLLTIDVLNRDNQILVDSFTISRSNFIPGVSLMETLMGEDDNTNTLALSISVICVNGFTGPDCATPATTQPIATSIPTTQPITMSVPTTQPNTMSVPTTQAITTSTPTATVNTPAVTNEPVTELLVTTADIQDDTTTDATNSTMDDGGAQARGLSEGGVAGIVIVFLIGAAIAVVVIIVVIWFYRNKKTDQFTPHDPSKHQVVDNPNYLMVEFNADHTSSNVSPAPVYQSTHLNQLEQTLDNDNPLYFSTETANGDYSIPPDCHPPVKPARTDEADYEYPEPPLPSQPPPPPHNLHTLTDSNEDYALPPDAFTSSAKVPQIEESDYDLPPDEQENSYSSSNRPPLSHSASTGSLGNQLNPYGEYSDGTIKRVASQLSVNKEMFDNADYAIPILESSSS